MANYLYMNIRTKQDKTAFALFKADLMNSQELPIIFTDKPDTEESQKTMYNEMKQVLTKGDILYIPSMNALGTKAQTIIQEWNAITKTIGADIIVCDAADFLNTTILKEKGKAGEELEQAMLFMLSYMEKTDNDLQQNLQREGIEKAMSEGRMKGRPKLEVNMERWEYYYAMWKNKEIPSYEFCKKSGLKKSKFYRFLKEYEAGLEQII